MKHISTKAITSVIAEMNRQDEKWGADRNQHPFIWQTILSEEVGEFSQQFCMMNLAAINQERRAKRWCRSPPSLSRLSNITIAVVACGGIRTSSSSACAASHPAGREKIGGCDWLDWNELSALGLIVRINAEILHPLGLAIFRDPASGISAGAMIAPDGKWEYAPDIIEGLRVRLSDHSGKYGHF